MSAPLDGILVVSIEQAVAAPYCTARLAGSGARVIKVERPGGDFARAYDKAADGESVWFIWLNPGKESLEIDFKVPEDAALLRRILTRADVFVQNLSPGAAARAGFGSADLRQAHPRLITCDISGYGEDGPYREMRAYDMLVQAESGLASISGTPDAPGRVGVSICDLGTGLNAYGAITEALYARERSGEGATLAVSMFDAMADWMGGALLMYERGGIELPRTGLSHPVMAPYGAFPVQGGGQLLISIQNEREWLRLVRDVLERPDLLERPEFQGNTERSAHREALDGEISAAFLALPRAELEARLRRHGIAHGAINSVPDLARHPQLRRASVDGLGGPMQIPAMPVRGSGAPSAVGSVPRLGEHSARLRAEFAE